MRGITSPPLESTHGRQRQVWHDITGLGLHKRSDQVRSDMPSPPLDCTNDRMTLSVACHHLPWAAHTVGLRRAWHDITGFGQHKRSNDIGRGMPSSPLGSTKGRTTSGVACHHRLWAAQTVERRRAWHEITALRQHTRSDDVRRDMPSPPFDCTNDWTTSGVA